MPACSNWDTPTCCTGLAAGPKSPGSCSAPWPAACVGPTKRSPISYLLMCPAALRKHCSNSRTASVRKLKRVSRSRTTSLKKSSRNWWVPLAKPSIRRSPNSRTAAGSELRHAQLCSLTWLALSAAHKCDERGLVPHPNSQFDFHRRVKRQRRHSHCGARVLSRLTKYFAKQFARSGNYARLAGETLVGRAVVGARHEPGYFNDPRNIVNPAYARRGRRGRIKSRDAREPFSLVGRNIAAPHTDKPQLRQLSVNKWQLARGINKSAVAHRWNISSNGRCHRRKFQVQFREAL